MVCVYYGFQRINCRTTYRLRGFRAVLNMWIPKDRIPIQVLLYSFRAVLNMWIPKGPEYFWQCVKNKKNIEKRNRYSENLLMWQKN